LAPGTGICVFCYFNLMLTDSDNNKLINEWFQCNCFITNCLTRNTSFCVKRMSKLLSLPVSELKWMQLAPKVVK
jgi:hypothetical protein